MPVKPNFKVWTLALTSVAFFMVALDTLVVVTALPAINGELGSYRVQTASTLLPSGSSRNAA
jgi:hypothetical protein